MEKGEHHEHHRGEPAHSSEKKWRYLSVALLVILAVSVFGNIFMIAKLTGYVGPPKGNYKGGVDFVGKTDAAVTMVMYTDFQCPFCAKWYQETWPAIKENFVDTGLVKFQVKNFPLSFHSNANIASLAAECAKEQGHFLDYEDLIYANQGALDRASLIGYAGQAGADAGKFAACLDEGRYQEKIDADQQEGSASGISGTPGFLINGVEFPVGASPYSVFEAEFNRLLGN